ncbi:L-cystine transporter [Atopobacter phocae]|uniref:L-cystine transporter n=1 Tax=Atopobacter phocae TaxID=136492 RepID=UPI0004708472|nr:cation:dicarboxylase symporter family transporter [Atopobacter phocae]
MLGHIIFFLIVFTAILLSLYWMQKIHVPYSRRVLLGLIIGIIFGAIIQVVLGTDSDATKQIINWINLVGYGYVRFLQMLIIPLIVVSLIRAFTRIEGESNLGRIGTSVLATLLSTVFIAALVGITSVIVFQLAGSEFTKGSAEAARIISVTEQQSQVSNQTLPEQLLNFIPTNVFQDLAGSRPTSVISVVVFSIFAGVGYLGVARKQPEQAAVFKTGVDSLYAIISRIVTLVLRMAPYGIFALMTKALATSSFKALINMGTFVIASYTAIIMMFIIHGVILLVARVNPLTYYKKVWPVLSFAFTSRSSAGALPMNIETQIASLGVDRTTANLAGTFGLSIGQNGCAGIYPAMLVAIIGPTMGLDLSDPTVWLMIAGTVAISSFGVAGVGGGATFAALIVFGTLGLPVEIIGLLVSVEPIIDMARTSLNVNDSMVAGVIASRRIGQLNDTILNDMNQKMANNFDH